MPERHPLHGYLLIGGAACCWGASAPLGRAMFTGQLHFAPLDPAVLTEGRIVLAALLLWPALALLRRGRLRLPWKQALQAALLGVVGMSAGNYFYYLAISRTTVATAIVLQYTAPIWVLIYMVARKRQRATAARLAAVGLALTGIALVVGWIHSGAGLRLDPVGVAGALLAALTYAYYIIGGEALTQAADPILISLYMMLGAGAVWLIIQPPWELWAAHYNGAQWGFLLIFSILATLAPTLLYISGLRYLDPTRAVITSCLEPVSGILLAAVFLGEGLNLLRIAGVGCVIGAIILVQYASHPAPTASPAGDTELV